MSLPGAPPGDIGARVTFEWMPGERFLVQRWQIPVPEAPDGLAVIGFDEGRGTLLQHYFDSRGVARVYVMTLAGGLWTLSREEPDFSPFDFAQRYEGTFSEDGQRDRRALGHSPCGVRVGEGLRPQLPEGRLGEDRLHVDDRRSRPAPRGRAP